MAFREIELTEEEKSAMGGAGFFKFQAIGDRLAGVFVRTQPRAGQFAKPGQLSYVFRAKDAQTGGAVELVVDPPTDAAKRLEKAKLKAGHKVILTYVSDQDIGKESPLKIFKLQVDDSAGAPAPKPPPPPAADDDLNF